MFMRVIHIIHTMRLAHPDIIILLCTFDLSSAYILMHVIVQIVAKCIYPTIICALIYLRLTSGGSFTPSEWCILIELLTDLANTTINNPFWNHKKTQSVQPTPESIPSPIM